MPVEVGKRFVDFSLPNQNGKTASHNMIRFVFSKDEAKAWLDT